MLFLVLARDYQISDEVVIEAYGLKTLTQRTLTSYLTVADAFDNAQQADIRKKTEAARKVANLISAQLLRWFYADLSQMQLLLSRCKLR